MTSLHFQALMPLLILSAGATLLMLQIAFFRQIRVTVALTAGLFALAAASCLPAAEPAPLAVTPLLMADKLALLFCLLFCLAGLVTTVFAADYTAQREDQPEEFFLLLVLSTLGACVLAYAVHLIALLLGLELLSVALYALIAYPDKTTLPLEAASKYLVLSGAASATLLFGFALLYAMTGTMGFEPLGLRLSEMPTDNGLLLAAAVMIVSGLAFKLSLVPFHLWTPDVYQGAPAPVSGFLASVSKTAVFVVLLRWFIQADLFRYPLLIASIEVIAIVSMLAGNLLALQQRNVKRLLAYSSIAHMGYMLIILVAAANSGLRTLAIEAAVFYLIAYTATTLAAFGLLSLTSADDNGDEATQINQLAGLFWRHPLQAMMLLVALLSLAGIPLTAGFIGKFYLFNSAVGGYHWSLLASLIVGSGIGIYYYLRVVYVMTLRSTEHASAPTLSTGWYHQPLCLLLIGSMLLLGTFPAPLMEYIKAIL